MKKRFTLLILSLSLILIISLSFVSAGWFAKITGQPFFRLGSKECRFNSDCPTGQECEGRECVPKQIVHICMDTDDYINDQYLENFIKGVVWATDNSFENNSDYCHLKDKHGNIQLIESCIGSNCYVSEGSCLDLNKDGVNEKPERNSNPCENGCEDGKCLKGSEAGVCRDSDDYLGNINIQKYTKGHSWTTDNSLSNRTDYCYDLKAMSSHSITSCDSSTCWLQEHSCDGNNSISSGNAMRCENGCYDGACKEREDLCKDNDGGRVPYKKGKITLNGGPTNNKEHCINGNREVRSCEGEDCKVLEYSCEQDGKGYKDTIQSEEITCLNGCRNGACTQTRTNFLRKTFNFRGR
jgi:hypothetical protein